MFIFAKKKIPSLKTSLYQFWLIIYDHMVKKTSFQNRNYLRPLFTISSQSSQKIITVLFSAFKMAFYQLFIKFIMKFNFIGTIIILATYLFLSDINNLNVQFGKANVTLFPNDLEITKIDVGQGDDIWILTTNHTVKYKFIFSSK